MSSARTPGDQPTPNAIRVRRRRARLKGEGVVPVMIEVPRELADLLDRRRGQESRAAFVLRALAREFGMTSED